MSTLRLVVFSGDLLQNKSEILIKKGIIMMPYMLFTSA
jgi:hypothetical protein